MFDVQKSYEPIYAGVIEACTRIVGMNGKHPEMSMSKTDYVIHGRTCYVKTATSEYSFWVGINGPRLFFIAYLKATPERAQDVFKFCFGGAGKVGWTFNYEPIAGGVSVWGNCMTDKTKPLTEKEGGDQFHLTQEGDFWVTDIAMMAQSWIRTCEREGIFSHEKEPAPL